MGLCRWCSVRAGVWVDEYGRAICRECSERVFRSRPTRVFAGRRVARNDPCPCGSGKKFKVCCLRRVKIVERVEARRAGMDGRDG